MSSKNQQAWCLAVMTALLPACALESSAEPSQPPLAVAPFDAATARQHQQAWARHLSVEVEIENSIGMKLTLIPPGEFMMGSSVSAAVIHRLFPGGQLEWYEPEHPRHKVRITRAYYLGTHEVTVGDFERFVSATDYKTTAEKERYAWGYTDGQWRERAGLNWRNPGFRQTPTHPVTCISWDDAVAFCQWLSREEGRTYRLPTEAEWEYACRAGTETLFFWGDNPDAGQGYLNAADLTGAPDGLRWPKNAFSFRDGYAAVAPVGRFKPNAFGLRDMLGNVAEWCSDWYGSYASNPVDNPMGPDEGSLRVLRGGSWSTTAGTCRSACRLRSQPSARDDAVGFRVALSSVEPSGQ